MFYIGSNWSSPANENALGFARFIRFAGDNAVIEEAKALANLNGKF